MLNNDVKDIAMALAGYHELTFSPSIFLKGRRSGRLVFRFGKSLVLMRCKILAFSPEIDLPRTHTPGVSTFGRRGKAGRWRRVL